jgi:hypothetical protein
MGWDNKNLSHRISCDNKNFEFHPILWDAQKKTFIPWGVFFRPISSHVEPCCVTVEKEMFPKLKVAVQYAPEMSMAARPRRTHGGGSGTLFVSTVAARRGSGSFQKQRIRKTHDFTRNLRFKGLETVKFNELHRLEAISLV